ncbi:hypothetical protein Pse7429DRAFT_1921 [Pseudanabaena biceps PCC 7429]|uniref:Uncharacterized protein n=1 Tax=Pseudanabaena biceps PCC 7429 TaxID=927668 RepID=L8N2E7_9CYAN|nr:hypothetical protein Pse7429DRAFT_1921 [Pseudanabaena biceps PCC 7429]
MFKNLGKIIALPLSTRYFDSTPNLLDSRFNSTRANGNSLCLKSLVVRDTEAVSFEIGYNPYSARNGSGKTIRKEAQGGDSSVGRQKKRILKYEGEE